MKRIFFFFLFLFLIIGIFLFQGIYLPKAKGDLAKKDFLIEKGESIKEISLSLEKNGLIKSRFFFQIYILFKGKAPFLQAGQYELSRGMNIPEIASKFFQGETIKKKITIIEGWNLNQIGDYLGKKGVVSPSKFINYCQKNKLEGYLFPDTYEIKPGEKLKNIVQEMVDNFNRKLTFKLRKKIKEEKKTIPEIITMASLVEKEAKTSKDRKIIAGILWKRLEYNMPLQVDATINYLKRGNGRIYKKDLDINSPYNTYKYLGLPPGPICNPGMESIMAAIYPEKSDYFYYLSGRDGKIYFSRTLKEHNLNWFKYLRK